jgi:hypothetical protein
MVLEQESDIKESELPVTPHYNNGGVRVVSTRQECTLANPLTPGRSQFFSSKSLICFLAVSYTYTLLMSFLHRPFKNENSAISRVRHSSLQCSLTLYKAVESVTQ